MFGQLDCELCFGFGELGNSGMIGGSGHGKIGNGINSVLDIESCGIVSRVVACLVGHDLGVMILLMGEGEIKFEVDPGLVGDLAALPFLACFGKHAGGKNKHVGNGDDLVGAVQCPCSIS